MNATIRYLDAAKARAGLISDYALAKRLGMPQSTMSSYRTGRRQLDALAAFQVAELAGIDAREVIAAVELDKAKTAREREFWMHAAKVAACILLAPVLATMPIESRAFASFDSATGYTLRRFLHRFCAVWNISP